MHRTDPEVTDPSVLSLLKPTRYSLQSCAPLVVSRIRFPFPESTNQLIQEHCILSLSLFTTVNTEYIQLTKPCSLFKPYRLLVESPASTRFYSIIFANARSSKSANIWKLSQSIGIYKKNFNISGSLQDWTNDKLSLHHCMTSLN